MKSETDVLAVWRYVNTDEPMSRRQGLMITVAGWCINVYVPRRNPATESFHLGLSVRARRWPPTDPTTTED